MKCAFIALSENMLGNLLCQVSKSYFVFWRASNHCFKLDRITVQLRRDAMLWDVQCQSMTEINKWYKNMYISET